MKDDKLLLPRVLAVFVVLMAVMGVGVPLYIYMRDHQNYVRLTKYAEECFYEEIAPVYIKCIRESSGLEDVEPVFELLFTEKEDFDAGERKLSVGYVASYYTSDQIDRYYVERWDDEDRLLPFFHRFRSGILGALRKLDEPEPTFESDFGTVVFRRRWVFNPAYDHGIMVKTSEGRTYSYGYHRLTDGWFEDVDIDSALVAYGHSPEAPAQKKEKPTWSPAEKERLYRSLKESSKSDDREEIDPDDYDLEAFYEDYGDEFEDEDDAWEAFLEDEDVWDDY